MTEATVVRQPNLRDDTLSDCRSFGSNCHPSNQSRKISIGIMVESPANGKSRGSKELESMVPNANQSSVFKFGNSKEKNLDEANCQMEGIRDTTNQKLYEFAFATRAEVRSDKIVIEDQANKLENRTETLKMKLWEILGTVSVPNDLHAECQNHEQDAHQLISKEIVVQKHDRAVRFKQNSDSIETDSENPGQTLKRPIVRSIARKRSGIFVQSRKSKTASYNKGKHQEGNVFVFEEWSEGTHVATDGASSMCTRKKSGERSFKFQPRKKFLAQKEDKMETFSKPTRIKELAPQDKPSSYGEVQGFHISSANHVIDKKDEQKEFNQFPQMDKTVSIENIHSAADYSQQEDIDNAFSNKDVDPHSPIESPTFRMKTPVCNSPSPTPKVDKVVCESLSPGSTEEILATRNVCSFRKLLSSEEDCDKLNVKPHFSEDDKEIEQSPFEKAGTGLTEGVADYGLSDSSSEDSSYESYAEGHPSFDVLLSRHGGVDSSQRDTFSPKIGAIKMFKSMLHPTKRARNVEKHEFEFDGPGESSCAEEILVLNEEDGLARAAKLFLSELEKLKSKISSISIEKSSEVLLSVAESIHLQLQNVDSQIQMDMVKLLSFGKSRRKVLETKFEEQQQQLKHMNQKFKEEVNQHLQDCRNALHELEAQQIEFKRNMEKNKSSHRSKLLQVEEEVNMQLKDAQRRIEAIHKSGRGKIVQLKQIIAMCLK